MSDFLQRVLNAQIVVTLLAMLAATVLRSLGLVPADVWADVVNTARWPSWVADYSKTA